MTISIRTGLPERDDASPFSKTTFRSRESPKIWSPVRNLTQPITYGVISPIPDEPAGVDELSPIHFKLCGLQDSSIVADPAGETDSPSLI